MPAGELTQNFGTPILRVEFPTTEEKQKILFMGDLHWDHAHADRKAIKRFLDRAVAEDAWVVLLGDTFDLMQGKFDKRSSKSAIRPEHNNENYFGSVIETALDWFEPYADRIWCMLDGNHETAVIQHHEFNVTQAFIREMNNRTGSSIHYHEYGGYAIVRATIHGTMRTSKKFYLYHGAGGGGPVTGGSIKANRRAVVYPDAHFVVSGHIHKDDDNKHVRARVTDAGKPYLERQKHYVVNTFKNEYGKGKRGYVVQREYSPTLPAAWMVTFQARNKWLYDEWVFIE